MNLNEDALKLINIMSTEPWVKSTRKETGSLADRPVTDITDKIVGIQQIAWDLDEFNNKVAVYSYKEPIKKGINELNFNLFEEFISKIICLPKYSEKLSKDFIENRTFIWLLENYNTSDTPDSFVLYLDNCMFEAVQNYSFYFPIYNLELERPFTLGYTKLDWLREDNFQSWKRKNSEIRPRSIENGDITDLLEKYDIVPGITFAQVTIEAESELAERLAIEHITNSLNCLKVFSEAIVFPQKNASFGIFSMIEFNKISSYLVENKSGEFSISLKVKNNIGSINFDYGMIEYLNLHMFPIANKYLTKKMSSEMEHLVLQSINLMGVALAKNDIYERVLILFTIVESIFVPDSQEHKIAETSRSNICWYMIKEMKERNLQMDNVKSIYDIRHKYVHKAKKISIDYKRIAIFQMLIANTIIRLMSEVILYSIKDDLISKITDLKNVKS